MKCYNKTPLKYNLEEFPVENIVLDGYTFNKHNISGCHKYVF